MKKAFIILLMLVYGTATMGTTIQHHFCMDEYVGWSLYGTTEDTCGRCGMNEEESKGCCKNENEHFKLKTDHQNSAAYWTKSLVLVALPYNSLLIVADYYHNSNNNTFPLCNAPPNIGSENLYLINAVFRI